MYEGDEHQIELVESTEDSAKSLQPPKQSFDLVTLLVDLAIVFPGLQSLGIGRHDRIEAQLQRQLPRVVSLIGAVHDQVAMSLGTGQRAHQRSTGRPISGLPRTQGEGEDTAIIRGSQMNFGGPATSGSTDGLCAVFFRAPVPSG